MQESLNWPIHVLNFFHAVVHPHQSKPLHDVLVILTMT